MFLATTGAAVVASAVDEGGRGLAVVTVIALLIGVSLMDSAMVLLGAGAHRVSDRFLRILGDVLAIAMGALGVWLIVRGIVGMSRRSVVVRRPGRRIPAEHRIGPGQRALGSLLDAPGTLELPERDVPPR